MEKGRNCSLGAISPLSIVFCNLILDFCVKTRTRFFLRDKRLFELIEVEIRRVGCISFFLSFLFCLSKFMCIMCIVAIIHVNLLQCTKLF